MFHINGTNNQSAYLTFPPGLPWGEEIRKRGQRCRYL